MSSLSFYTDKVIFDSGDGLEMLLEEDNAVGLFITREPELSRVAIQDPRDDEWWVWYRGLIAPRDFGQLSRAVCLAGLSVYRQVAPQEIRDNFMERARCN